MRSGETFSINNSEKDREKSDEYYISEGVEYRNINKIDISTDQGKFEWLDSLVDNASARIESKQENIISEEGLYGMNKEEQEEYLKYNDAWQDNKLDFDIAKRQSKILENLDINGGGGVFGALERIIISSRKVVNNPNASEEARMAAFQNQSAATDLYMILAGEITRRDPNYFSPLEISTALKSELTQAERRVEQTMVDGYFGEDGFLHTTSNGEKMPSAATEDAEIDLEYAKQDVETFNLLMDNYQAINNYTTPPAIRKADFVPTIDKFINDHITQIGQLIEKSKILTKDSPEYTENKAKRRKLAGERSSARRLIARYFNVPETESTSSPTSESNTDDDMNMEKISTGKTKEQIEAEKTKKRQSKENKHQQQTHENTQAREHQQEKPPASYHFERGLVDKEITITVGQEIPDDWFESKKHGNRTNNGYGIEITRPPQIEDYLLRALNIEFGKLSEDERRSYNYRALAETIISEAKRTKKIPDIANIINHQQGINTQHKKLKRSHRQGASRQIEEELEDEMSM